MPKRQRLGTTLMTVGLILLTCSGCSTTLAAFGATDLNTTLSSTSTSNTTASTSSAPNQQSDNTMQTSTTNNTDNTTYGNATSSTTANVTTGKSNGTTPPSNTKTQSNANTPPNNAKPPSTTNAPPGNAKPPSTTNAPPGNAKPPSAPSTPPTLALGANSSYVLYLQQVLAVLGYLPLTLSNSSALVKRATTQASYMPVQGRWAWKFRGTPTSLKGQWVAGSYNQMTRGAVMTFQEVNHLTIDGVTGPNTWLALKAALKQGQHNPFGYAYVYTSSIARPQNLKIWLNGRYVLSTLVNTGISSSPTPFGTWPIYVRFLTQTMSGHTPWGSYYSDPGVPWVNYFYGGCAIHGFVRASYGSPQSLGCIELPPNNARIAWNYIHYGTLVTVGP